MKRTFLFLLILLSVTMSSFAQIKFRALSSVGGVTLARGGEFDYIIQANGNGNTSTRQLLFDVQYDKDNFEIVSVNHTGTGGNGGVLPQNSNPQISWTNYPLYNFVTSAQNTTANGTTNYQFANYNYSTSNVYAILRATLTWSTNSGMPYTGYDRMIVIKFRLRANSTAFSFNPIRLNFVAGWTGAGQWDNTIMESPLSTSVIMNQNFGKYISAKVDLNTNLFNLSNVRVSFRDTATNTGVIFPVTSTGEVDINQSQLAANKVYDITVMHELDKLYTIYNNAITISDFTTSQSEFTSMGLDGSKGVTLKTGQSLYAADINRNRSLDGGDLPRLLSQVTGIDTLITLPAGYVAGSGGFMSLPTWLGTDAITTAGQVEWCVITPNAYGQGVSRIQVDMREFNGTGVTPADIKSIQLFDIFSGVVEFMSNDATWATYKVVSNLSKATDGSSVNLSNIRNINGSSDYGLQAEFTFNTSPGASWNSITTSNWKNITAPKVFYRTGALGTNQFLDLKYLLWGDVNRSHSSQVVVSSAGTNTVQTNAAVSMQTNTAFRNEASLFVNNPGPVSESIDVNLTNLTVTSNSVEIPVSVDPKGALVSGLQFEFTFDPAKIKFEELLANVPNTWYVFASCKDGRVKFGALDQNKTTSLSTTTVPFKLKFSTIGEGVNIITSVKVSALMDASDAKGNQLGMNLNTTQIKLTGYNNF
jgi:hypothetical protein